MAYKQWEQLAAINVPPFGGDYRFPLKEDRIMRRPYETVR
jgi:hypothetical protein